MNDDLRNQLDGERLDFDVDAGWDAFAATHLPPAPPTPPTSPSPSSTRRWWPLFALALLMVAGAGAWYATSQARDDSSLVVQPTDNPATLREDVTAGSAFAKTGTSSPAVASSQPAADAPTEASNQSALNSVERPAATGLRSDELKASALSGAVSLAPIARPATPSRRDVDVAGSASPPLVDKRVTSSGERAGSTAPPRRDLGGADGRVSVLPAAISSTATTLSDVGTTVTSGAKALGTRDDSTVNSLTAAVTSASPEVGRTVDAESPARALSTLPAVEGLLDAGGDDLANRSVPHPRNRLRIAQTWTIGLMAGIGYEHLSVDYQGEGVPFAVRDRVVLEQRHLSFLLRQRFLERWGVTLLAEASQRHERVRFSESSFVEERLFNAEAYVNNGTPIGDTITAITARRRTFENHNRHTALGLGLTVDYIVPTRACDYSIFAGARYNLDYAFDGQRILRSRNELYPDRTPVTSDSPYRAVSSLRYIVGTRAETPLSESLRLLIEARVTFGATYDIAPYDSGATGTERGQAFALRLGLGYTF